MVSIGVCWKVVTDDVTPGVSPADEAALEIALRLAGRGGSVDAAGPVEADSTITSSSVTVASVAGPAADDVLRSAAAVGADRLVRVDQGSGVPPCSASVAAMLASVLSEADIVLCGDYSLDRGSGSVPAFLAGELGAAQALGLVAVDHEPPAIPLRVVRRLDGGRREVLEVPTPCVLSVEGSIARLRRAALPDTLASRTATVEVVPSPGPTATIEPVDVEPYRPRARVMPGPVGDTLDRVRSILDVGGAEPSHRETVHLEPEAAADRILQQLRDWGHLDPG
jgi:electron transfer flavoprotein beta subunit